MSKGNTQRFCMNPNKDQKAMSTNITLPSQPSQKKRTDTKTQQHKIQSSRASSLQTLLPAQLEPQPSIKVQKKEDKQQQPQHQNRVETNSIELIVNKMKQGIQTINKKTIEKVGGDVVIKLKEFVEKEKQQFKKKNQEKANIVIEKVKVIQEIQVKKLEEMKNEMKSKQREKIKQEEKLQRVIKQLQKESKQKEMKLEEANNKNKQNEKNKKTIQELNTKLQQLNTQNQYLEHDNKRLTQIKGDHEILINNLRNSLANRQKQLNDVKTKLILEQKIRNQLEKNMKIIKDDVKKAKTQIIGMFGYKVQGSNYGNANGNGNVNGNGNGNANGNVIGNGGQRRNLDLQEIQRIGISQVYANCLQPFTKFRDRFMPIANKLLKIQINNENCSNIQQIPQFNQLKTLLTFLPPQPPQSTSLKTISILLSTLLQHLSTQITYTSNIKKYIVSLQQSMKIINNTISEIIKKGSYHTINVIKDYNGKQSCVYQEMRDIGEKVRSVREEVGREREEVGRERGEKVRLEGVVKEMRQYIGQLQDFKSKVDKNTEKYQQKLREQRKQIQQLKLNIQTLQTSVQTSAQQIRTLTQRLEQKEQEIKKIQAQNKKQWKVDMQNYVSQITRIKIQCQKFKQIYNKLESEIGEERRKYEERLREKDEVIGGLRAESEKLTKLSQFANKFAQNSE